MGAGFGRQQEKSDKNVVPGLEISIDEIQNLAISWKNRQKSMTVVSGMKIDGCMHPLPQIEGCSCTRTNKGPARFLSSNYSLLWSARNIDREKGTKIEKVSTGVCRRLSYSSTYQNFMQTRFIRASLLKWLFQCLNYSFKNKYFHSMFSIISTVH